MITPLTYLVSMSLFLAAWQSDFLAKQKRYERVRTAVSEKEADVIANLKAAGIELKDLNLLIVAFKAERELLLYAKSKNDDHYRLLHTYEICASSGELGPKSQEGDAQVPEGFYHIDRFNPSSRFYLSLGVNYPNQSDKRRSKATLLGGDIFIHGACVTIGCLPMTDDKIKEIYLYAVHARNNGQEKIPVYVFPFKMSDANMEKYREAYPDEDLQLFWKNIKQGYDRFVAYRRELSWQVSPKGDYTF